MRFISLVFVYLTIFVNAQPKWDIIDLDELASFSLPPNYTKMDTLGQELFHASTGNGYIQIAKIPQPQAQLRNEKELIDYYKAFQKITVEQSNGTLISDTTALLGPLHARTFLFETYWNDSLEVQENLIVMINHAMYSFTYAYPDSKQLNADKEKDYFFSGITIRDVDFEDQLTTPDANERWGTVLGKYSSTSRLLPFC